MFRKIKILFKKTLGEAIALIKNEDRFFCWSPLKKIQKKNRKVKKSILISADFLTDLCFFWFFSSDPFMDLESLGQYAGINLEDIDIDSYMNSVVNSGYFKQERD